MFEMNDIMLKKTQVSSKLSNHVLGIKNKHYLTFESLYLHLYYL
jgi:hypothetical protein